MNVIELTDEEIGAIPQDKRIKILQAQIEGGRAELDEKYQKFEELSVELAELQSRGQDLQTAVIDERKKVQQKENANETQAEQLRVFRTEIAKYEEKLRLIKGDDSTQTIKDANIDRLASQLDREQANVLKLQAQIERRRNELAQIDVQYQNESEDKKIELQQLVDEKRKTMDLIGFEMQRLKLLKQRNSVALKSLSSYALDSQLTAVLESFAEGETTYNPNA